MSQTDTTDPADNHPNTGPRDPTQYAKVQHVGPQLAFVSTHDSDDSNAYVAGDNVVSLEVMR